MGRRRPAGVIIVLAPPGELAPGAALSLEPEETHHLRVRRARPGDPVRLVDGKGVLAEGRVGPGDGPGRVEVVSVERVARPAALALAVGAGDRDRFSWLVEKSAELAVTDIIPLETERTSGVSSRVRAEHIEKLQRRALEAIKQSGALWAPVVHLPHTLAELMVRHRDGLRWLADAAGDRPAPLDPGRPVVVAVGPEGGFTTAERALLIDGGWLPVRLARQVLRFETAALAAATLAGLNR